ncbi:RhoGEF domain containing protein [Acanthamoeba castellanii str. Neff]|uniref:RhoGEF domain containing protein n=1 Tax=Acanthamoeba castellanii (strain ATCC 30010 / Neff) TaxID=1257118 RepID=L8GHK2_ACACF|nr:RhoGEF domain containing protein [Acanthamoeba castellanii str. Neff]ELR11651.1 RhoGEF domain containing protein [Acanthamoeba castellanii str. Neff]
MEAADEVLMVDEVEERKRRDVARELLDTERTYVANITTYLQPLRVQGLVAEEQLGHMFGNIERLWAISSELLAALEDRLHWWGPHQQLGDVFLRLVYDEYYHNYDRAVETVDTLERQDAGFKQFLLDQVQVGGFGCEALTLGSRLILPIQRLPRYLMLLGALAAKTPAGHPDQGLLREALEQLQETATRIDDQLKRMENRNRIYHIQSQLFSCPVLATPDRVLLREGVVLKLSSSFAVNCTIFLFSDVLVYAHRSLKSFSLLRYKGTINLAECFVRSIPDSDEFKNAFQVLVAFEKPLTLYTKKAEDKVAWMAAIQDAIDALLAAEPDLVDQRKSWKPSKKSQGVWRLLRDRNLLKRSPDTSDSDPSPLPSLPTSTSSSSSSSSSSPSSSSSSSSYPSLALSPRRFYTQSFSHSAPLPSVEELTQSAEEPTGRLSRVKSGRLRQRKLDQAQASRSTPAVASRHHHHQPLSADSSTSPEPAAAKEGGQAKKEKRERQQKDKETRRKHLLHSLTLRRFSSASHNHRHHNRDEPPSSLSPRSSPTSPTALSPSQSPRDRLAQLLSPRLPPLTRQSPCPTSSGAQVAEMARRSTAVTGRPPTAQKMRSISGELPRNKSRGATATPASLPLLRNHPTAVTVDDSVVWRSSATDIDESWILERMYTSDSGAFDHPITPSPTSAPVSSPSPSPLLRALGLPRTAAASSLAAAKAVIRGWEPPEHERPKHRHRPPSASGSPHRHQRGQTDSNHLP